MSDAQLMHFRDTHNHQSVDRAMAIRVLQEREDAKKMGDFDALYRQGERGHALNRRVLRWAIAAFLVGVVAALAGLIQAYFSWRGAR